MTPSPIYYFIIFLVCCFSYSCQSPSQQSSSTKDAVEKTTPLKIIFDTDMGSDCDDVGALALLHKYADEGKAEILGCIYSSGKIPYGAGVIDAINHYYNRPNIPIGAAYDTLIGDPVDKMNAEELAKDTSAFHHNIILNTDAHEQTYLNRELLLNQEDNSVIYITVGHTKGLYDILASKPDANSPLSGVELVSKKIKYWVALGALRANNYNNELKKDWNFFFNGTAPYTEHLVKNFPKPIYFVDAGNRVMTGKSLVNTPDGNIVRQAYTDWLNWYGGKTLADQRPSWDLATIYYAVEGLGNFLHEEENGWLEFDAGKGCVWREGENEFQHHFITQKADTDSLFASYLNRIIAQAPK